MSVVEATCISAAGTSRQDSAMVVGVPGANGELITPYQQATGKTALVQRVTLAIVMGGTSRTVTDVPLYFI